MDVFTTTRLLLMLPALEGFVNFFIPIRNTLPMHNLIARIRYKPQCIYHMGHRRENIFTITVFSLVVMAECCRSRNFHSSQSARGGDTYPVSLKIPPHRRSRRFSRTRPERTGPKSHLKSQWCCPSSFNAHLAYHSLQDLCRYITAAIKGAYYSISIE